MTRYLLIVATVFIPDAIFGQGLIDLVYFRLDSLGNSGCDSVIWGQTVDFGWVQDTTPAPERFVRGDCNGDATLDISDAIFNLLYLSAGGYASACPEACDSHGDGDDVLAVSSTALLSSAEPCTVLADKRIEPPLRTIAHEYRHLTGSQIVLKLLPMAEVNALVERKATAADVVLCMPGGAQRGAAVDAIAGACTVAWKYPSREPVWAAALTDHPQATAFVRFLGGPTGHRLWSESPAGFTIVPDTSAQSYAWVVENRTKHTYPLTAMRMLAECGGIRDGVCIDVGCGLGHLEVELAQRSTFKIIGLDIDPDVKPRFEKRIREARLEDRVSFVLGDAQKMPFPDDYADVIVSRGALIFIPDIAQCLRQVHRVLKPTGVAFLGGRYVYTPHRHKISTERLKKIVSEAGVPGARVIDARGQWVKIIGPQAPQKAHTFEGGPHMLANRFVADYAITTGSCLLICGADGGLQQAMLRGFLTMTDMNITAMYPSRGVADQANKRIRAANLSERITCTVGAIDALPFEPRSFDLVAGVGPILIRQKDKVTAMRELHRVLRRGGAALVGGRYLGMPAAFRVSSEALRRAAAETGIPSIRVYDDMGQWVELRKGIRD
jgi:ubiquinone/menaquinone biosynthesis C-methylase UbiE